MATTESGADLGSGLFWGKADCPLLVINNRCIPVLKNEMKCIAFCACDDNTGICCIIRAVKKFDSRLVTNETSNKCRPMARKSHSDRDFLQDLCFPVGHRREC
jgi:hypothetical protein